MKYLLFISITLSTYKGYCQNLKEFIQDGIYSGGICSDGAICGEWILKSDSSFAFFQIEKASIKKMEFGKILQIDDTTITVKFQSEILPILSNSKVNYSSETRTPFDTIYIVGKLKNLRNEPIPYSSISFGNGHFSISDKDGDFYSTFSRNERVNEISILNRLMGYLPITISLNKNNNSHNLTINIPVVDSLGYDAIDNWGIPNETYSFRIINSTSRKRSFPGLYNDTHRKEEVINILLNAKTLQPLLSMNIDKIINFINR